jgi:copper chaperone
MMLRLTVTGMDCDHCVATVTRAVQSVADVDAVEVDLPSGAVTVHGEPDVAAVQQAIVDEGYGVAMAA